MRAKSARAPVIKQTPAQGSTRAYRGLVLVFALSFVSLVGVMLTVGALGGSGTWTAWQFIGLFGLVEASSGLANIVSPNVWRLPVAETQTRPSTRVKLAASTILIPHWGGAARAVAGLVLMGAAAVDTGISSGTLFEPVIVVLLASAVVSASALVARLGVARPDLDVIQIVVRRAGNDHEAPPISIGASALQFGLSIVTIPVVKLIPPHVLYDGGMAPSPEALAITAAAATLLGAASLAAWQGRVEWNAPREQQREAEKFA